MHKILILLLLSVAISTAQETTAEPDTIWTRYIPGIESARFSPDGSKIVVSGDYNMDNKTSRIIILDSETGEEEHFIETPWRLASGFLTSDNRYFMDRTGVVVNLETLDTLKTYSYQSMGYNTDNGFFYGIKNTVVDNPDGSQEFIEPRIVKFSLETNKVLETYPLENMIMTDEVIISNDNRWLAVSGKTNANTSNPNWSLQLFEIIDGVPEFRKEIYRGTEIFRYKFNYNSLTLIADFYNGETFEYRKTVFDLIQLNVENEFDYENQYSSYGFYNDLIFWSSPPDFKFSVSSYDSFELIKQFDFKAGGFFFFSDTKLLTAGLSSIILMRKNNLLNSLSIETNILIPFEIGYEQIIIESQFKVQLFNQMGDNLSFHIQDNQINRENLPNGVYFLTIEGNRVNRVVKFFQAR